MTVGHLIDPLWSATLDDDGVWTGTDPDIVALLNRSYGLDARSESDGVPGWGQLAQAGRDLHARAERTPAPAGQ